MRLGQQKLHLPEGYKIARQRCLLKTPVSWTLHAFHRPSKLSSGGGLINNLGLEKAMNSYSWGFFGLVFLWWFFFGGVGGAVMPIIFCFFLEKKPFGVYSKTPQHLTPGEELPLS